MKKVSLLDQLNLGVSCKLLIEKGLCYHFIFETFSFFLKIFCRPLLSAPIFVSQSSETVFFSPAALFPAKIHGNRLWTLGPAQ